MRDYIYIDDNEQFRWLAVELSQVDQVAIDTESNSMYVYQGGVCLIQLSTRTADYIIDPFTIDDMSPLGVLLADPNIEKILHAAEYDLMLLKRDYGFTINNLYDTMVAARVAGHERHGLANLLDRYFDVTADKSHQRDNWGARPLPEDSLRYAQMDTHYLHRLRDLLTDELKAMGRWEESQELFKEAEDVPAAEDSYNPDGFWKLGQSNHLKRNEMAALRAVYLLRERLAQERDVPVHKIFSNQSMLRVVQDRPRNLRELGDIRGFSPAQVRRYGDDVLGALRSASAADLPAAPPFPEQPPLIVAERYHRIQQWRKTKGRERGVESDVVLPKAVMWQLAYDLPTTREQLDQTDGLGPQRFRLYADDLLELLMTLA